MLFTQTREDNPWPGQPRPSSRSALASKSTATCRPSSDPDALGCARRGGERVILVQFGASLRATERAPPKRGFFFEAATPRLVSGGRIRTKSAPGDGGCAERRCVGTRSRQVAQCLAGSCFGLVRRGLNLTPGRPLTPASINFTRHFPAPSGWRRVCLAAVFYASSQNRTEWIAQPRRI